MSACYLGIRLAQEKPETGSGTFPEVMNRMRQAQFDKEQEKSIQAVSEKKDPNRKIMSDAIEAKILKDLKEFERGSKYTDKQISLPILAGMLKTNTKYLSHVLNTYLNKDFNTYINELRVKYIIEKIEQDEKFKNYKLSVLAEECGFSSHSKFSAVFKSVTDFLRLRFWLTWKKAKRRVNQFRKVYIIHSTN